LPSPPFFPSFFLSPTQISTDTRYQQPLIYYSLLLVIFTPNPSSLMQQPILSKKTRFGGCWCPTTLPFQNHFRFVIFLTLASLAVPLTPDEFLRMGLLLGFSPRRGPRSASFVLYTPFSLRVPQAKVMRSFSSVRASLSLPLFFFPQLILGPSPVFLRHPLISPPPPP